MKTNDGEDSGFFRRYGLTLGIVSVFAGGGVFAATQTFSGHGTPSRPPPPVTIVKLLTPPPPPPPPPPMPQLQEPKMMEQVQVDDDEEKPQDDPPASNDAPIGTNITGNGPPDGFGLGANRGANLLGAPGPKKNSSRWGWYAAQVQSTIGEALRRNDVTQRANFRVEVRIWPDVSGRVTRATLGGTTGDAALDAALIKDVLTGMQLREPPPEGMPSPIVLRLTAQRPG